MSTHARVLELFYKAVGTTSPEAMLAACPDQRLTSPVGGYGFPGREFAAGHAYISFWPTACSGVRTPVPPRIRTMLFPFGPFVEGLEVSEEAFEAAVSEA